MIDANVLEYVFCGLVILGGVASIIAAIAFDRNDREEHERIMKRIDEIGLARRDRQAHS